MFYEKGLIHLIPTNSTKLLFSIKIEWKSLNQINLFLLLWYDSNAKTYS